MLPSRNRNAKFLVVAMTVMCLYVGRNLHGSIDMRRVESSSSSLDMNEMGFEPPVRLRVADNNPEGKPPQRHLDTIPSLTTLNTQQVNVSMGLQDFESHKPLRTHTTKDIRTTSVKEEEKQVSEEEASTTTSATKSHVATEAMGGPPLNILVLYPDDWRHNTIGKESSIVKTPFLDSLADQGIRFRQNAVTTSVCWVSRATLFTGQWASKHESHKTQCPHFAAGYRWRESSWPGILQKHGYFTGHVGKWQYKNSNENRFDFYHGIEGKHWFEKFHRGFVSAEDLAKEQALLFLKNRPKEKPFAMTVAFYPPKPVGSSEVPGAQFKPKNSTRALYENITIPELYNMTHARSLLPLFLQYHRTAAVARFRQRYKTQEHYQESMKNMYALITQVDQACRDIVEEIKAQGLLNETMIIFTTDNGMFNGAHGLAGKWYPYQESIRVPLIIHDPRMPESKRGSVNDEFTLNVDLAETILGAAGIPPHPGMQGRDIADLYLDEREAVRKERPWREEFFYEFNVDEGSYIPASNALVRKKFKYIRWINVDHEQLFNLEDDPFEFTDVKDRPEHADILNEMRERMAELKVEAAGGPHVVQKGCPKLNMTELDRMYSMRAVDPSGLQLSHTITNHSGNEATTAMSRNLYAYAFLIGGVHENRTEYRGFLYNVLISAQLLQDFGSTADVVVFWQNSPDSNLTQIPVDDARFLDALRIRTVLLPKPTAESFAHLMFEKFRVLDLLEYRRVIYLDSDIIPMNSLDYLFYLSDPSHTSTPTILQPNIMRATEGEPANGGMFMVQPSAGRWNQIQVVIERQREAGKKLPFPHFDKRIGCGHDFTATPGDNWHAQLKNGTDWRFYGASVDQGLLYYMMRFMLQNASHVVGTRVENWVSDARRSDNMYIANVFDDPLSEFSKNSPLLQYSSCRGVKPKSFYCYPPHRDFFHFDGLKKPWQHPIPTTIPNYGRLEEFVGYPRQSSANFWFWNLDRLNRRLHMGLNLTHWDTEHLPHMTTSPLGYKPLETDNADRIFGTTTKEEVVSPETSR